MKKVAKEIILKHFAIEFKVEYFPVREVLIEKFSDKLTTKAITLKDVQLKAMMMVLRELTKTANYLITQPFLKTIEILTIEEVTNE